MSVNLTCYCHYCQPSPAGANQQAIYVADIPTKKLPAPSLRAGMSLALKD
jgi:hypothetical protein